MNILCIGDVVGSNGCRFLRAHLPTLKKLKQIDLVIANGENSADGNGLTPAAADFLFHSGVDVITTGNHAFRRRESYPLYEQTETLLRPANYPESTTPGHGLCMVDMGRLQVCVINLMGTVYLESLQSPFETMDRLLEKAKEARIVVVDFHAEATGEKRALGYYLDGRISALFGTHTHVPTADETILPKGTGYITDVGMTGAIESVLGVKPELAIEKMKTKMPVRFDLASGESKMDCVLFDIDDKTGKTHCVERLQIR
ncbi:MAG: TIGR00282 family metallophosphoesterase [Clostridiales bacterium]|jgi:metallophosphoesterase (TIGR00282 family)|nr:TIGR00282 family metallophosphoesterase [Clostridiales bacterium]